MNIVISLQVKGEYLTVVEGGEAANYSIQPTIPILCGYNWENNQACGCELNILVMEPSMDPQDGDAAMCPDGQHQIKQTAIKHSFLPTQCGITIQEASSRKLK